MFAFYLTSAAHHDYRVPSHVPLQRFAEDEKRNRYLNAVAYQDGFLGRLLDVYRQEGVAERTLFVVIGDHGEAFGEHGRTLHDHVIYDEAKRVAEMFRVEYDVDQAAQKITEAGLPPVLAERIRLGY